MMEIPLNTILIGMLASMIIILIYFIWLVRVKDIYLFEIVYMLSGYNDHIFVRGYSLDFIHTYQGKKYTIRGDRLYRLKPGIMGRVNFKIRGIKQSFIVAFQKGKKTPINPQDIKVSSRVINTVNESKALGKAFKSEFAIPMDIKKILLVVGFLVIAVVIYLVATGQVIV